MKSFKQHINEADGFVSSATARQVSFKFVVKCGRGHNTTFTSPKVIRSDDYYGAHIVWECDQCPSHNNDFVVVL